jgi:glycerol-1-phosphate dehydrogenase [NAD(P)+]
VAAVARAPIIEGRGAVTETIMSFAGVPVVLTDPTVWGVASPVWPGEATVYMVESLERAWLDDLADRLATAHGPDRLLVGLGGGRVTDAAKYVANRTGWRYLLAPTNTASNAPYNLMSATREDGAAHGVRLERGPEAIILDHDLIARAPGHVNRAGVGDMLLLHTVPDDWDRAVRAGRATARPAVRAAISRLLRDLEDGTLSDDPANQMPRLFRLFRAHTELVDDHPELPLGFGSEHLVAWTLDIVAGRELLHGGTVALGAVLMSAWQENAPEAVVAVVRDTRTPWRPVEDLGITWEDVARALREVAAYNARYRGIHTVLEDRPLDDRAIERLVAYAESLG